MKHDPSPAEPVFGFLTVLEDASAGMLGGLLIVNRRGRPLEFHCTAPVAPSRAEEILFGPTLRPHFFSERIGAALLAKASAAMAVVFVHQRDAWGVAEETSVPVVMVEAATSDEANATPLLDHVEEAERASVEQLLAELTRYVDLAEPFERIVDAVREAGLVGSGPIEDSSEAGHAEAA